MVMTSGLCLAEHDKANAARDHDGRVTMFGDLCTGDHFHPPTAGV
jgi:hypothetical protein